MVGNLVRSTKLALGVSTLALIASTAAYAQSSGDAAVATSGAGNDAVAKAETQEEGAVARGVADDNAGNADIIVTGSRVARAGFSAPTPTSIIGSDTIAQRAQTSVTEVLNSLPSFRASITPASAGPSFRAAQSTPDLRGLGTVRTLLLIDGLRAVPTTTTGLSDLNLLPSLLIDRVEVVTGGASAGYGSDAVAGVVNVILKKDVEGIQGDITRGISDYGDNSEFRIGLIAGAHFADGRGRIMIGGEYNDNNGIGDQYQRPWGNQNYNIYSNGSTTNGLPQRLIVPDVYVSNLTTGGLITGVTGNASPALLNQAFRADGTPYAFQFGSLSTSTQTVGANVGANEGVTTSAQDLRLLIPIERYSVMARASYEIADNVTVYANGNVAGYDAASYTFPQRASAASALTIRADNPFLPASIAALMGTGTIRLGRQFTDDQPAQTFSRNRTYNGVVGLKGKFGGGWSWDIAGQYGRNSFAQRSPGQIVTTRLNRAVDAVSSGGQIVCRVNADGVTTNDDPSCIAFNPFGTGAPSAAALDYVSDTAWLRLVTKQQQYTANLRGEPFSTWAGPVSVAVGGEYRKISADQTVDANAVGNAYLNATSNQKPLSGEYNVKEAYLETVVPLLKDSAVGRSLEVNGAIRVTDYSTSGTVTTWKAGATYKPIDGILLRGTRSRDIRAPNIAELFTLGQVASPNTLTNPFRGNAAAGIVTVVTSGNLNLKPEIAKTTALGVVLQPRFLPGLSVSVDYYDIKLKDAIATLTNQVILNQCAAGNQTLCGLVSLDADNNITQIRNQTINIASYHFSGVDVEAAYRLPLSDLKGSIPGALNFNLNVNRTINAAVNDGVTGSVERAGDVGSTVSGGVGIGGPKWKGTLSLLYSTDRFSVGTQLRYIGKAKYDNTYAEPGGTPTSGGFTINDNSVPSLWYVNYNASVTVLDEGRRKLQFYGVINNAFDKAPPFVPLGGLSTNPAIYDTIGRTFKIGVRFGY